MARDTITAQFQLQARFETIQAIRRTLADEAAQAGWISLLSETGVAYLASKVEGDFELTVALKVPPVRRTRRGARPPLPKVEHGILSWYDEYAQITNIVGQVGSTAWTDWLENQWTRSFRYESDQGAFTAIKEDRRGRSVWYAHRRRAGQLKRLYLGKSENLTAAKLVEAARKLNA
jgi:hypothetical protein